MYGRAKELSPRNGHSLVVGIVARISGCQNQKEMSLEDQEDHAKKIVTNDFNYAGPVDYRLIATKGKGERLDRPELEQIKAMLRTRELDLLICEDIGRMVRGTEAERLCGIAFDHGTRVLAPNDCVDTDEESWEEDVISACRDHVGHNAHTSKRLKFKLMNRFKKFGGATAREIFGYVKPEGAKTYGDWQKDETATPIYEEWFRKLRARRSTAPLSRIGSMSEKVSTGKYARREKWDGKMVRRITSNPLLKGMPGRGFRHTVKRHETGRRVSVKNPDGPNYWECPHLIHVPAVEFDEVNALLNEKNKRCGRKPINGVDPLWRVPRKRTRFPGQYCRCWYCGCHFVWGANGQTQSLMCSASRQWNCWNSIGFKGPLAVQRIVEATTAALYQLQGFEEQFAALVQQAARTGDKGVAARWQKLHQDQAATAQKKQNLLEAIALFGPKPMFHQEIADLEAAERKHAHEECELNQLQGRTLQLPTSLPVLRNMLAMKFQELALDSLEFGAFMQQLVPEFYVYLVRLCDGGHPLPRAKLKLDVTGSIADAQYVPGLADLLTRPLTIDLFEPPQRERIRQEAVRLEAQGIKQRDIAGRLSEKVTQTAVQHALALDRRMREMNLDTPYVLMEGPPQDYPKLRRHLNNKYAFQMREGYERPPI